MHYFAISIFVSAFLLFQIQPIIGKLLLPWFGGAPAIWSVMMLFFQVLLIGGYAYAYWLINKTSTRRQNIVHLSILTITLGIVFILFFFWPSPVTPANNWKPGHTDFPILHIFILLTISVGLPYFVLSTNGPLMQAWFSKTYPKYSPYKLYSLSNIGSLLALISYPFIIEPLLSIRWQGIIWSAGFTCFALTVIYIAIRRQDNRQKETISSVTTTASPPKPAIYTQLFWLALPACASLMLLAITNHITEEIAAIPFLWILPLTIYLLSFILTFNSEHCYKRLIFSGLLLLASVGFIYVAIVSPFDLMTQIGAYNFLLFSCCMICHGELYRLRPHPRHLTRYYLFIAVGGAMGGTMVSLVAPLIFSDYWELRWGFAVCWLLLTILVFMYPPTLKRSLLVFYQSVLLGITLFTSCFAIQSTFSTSKDLMTVRNFYGIAHVREINSENPQRHIYALTHGATLHGFEFVAPEKHGQPTSYFFPGSGIGLAITHHPQRNKGMHIGVLGLGIGTLAAYGQVNDTYRFYEINPVIEKLAKGKNNYFHFLKDTPAKVNIILGDARVSLEKELTNNQKQNFDVLAMDTFSSDSIPTHLLTQEAFAVYLAHLNKNGTLAIHISNRNLNLKPVIWKLAKYYKLSAVLINAISQDSYHIASEWILLSRDTTLFNSLVKMKGAHWLSTEKKDIRLWTDDYNNLFQILK